MNGKACSVYHPLNIKDTLIQINLSSTFMALKWCRQLFWSDNLIEVLYSSFNRLVGQILNFHLYWLTPQICGLDFIFLLLKFTEPQIPPSNTRVSSNPYIAKHNARQQTWIFMAEVVKQRLKSLVLGLKYHAFWT